MSKIAMAAGTSRLIEIPVRDQTGANFDMAGGRAVFWVGKSVYSTGADVVIMKDNPSISSDVDGLWTVIVPLLPADTETLGPRASYYFECRVWDQADNEYVVSSGQFELDPSLTLPAATP